MQKENFFSILSPYVPANSLEYCYQLWSTHQFKLKINKARASKLGDYRFIPSKKQHIITVNHNLNPYNFLVTYIHEVAHLTTFTRFAKKVAPHGQEWKNSFRQLMIPLLTEKIFPADILNALQKHMQNPKASSCSDHQLTTIMRKYDPPKNVQLLGELHFGQQFMFRKRIFEKKSLKRTRVICREINSNQNYLISKFAEVKKLTTHQPELKQ